MEFVKYVLKTIMLKNLLNNAYLVVKDRFRYKENVYVKVNLLLIFLGNVFLVVQFQILSCIKVDVQHVQVKKFTMEQLVFALLEQYLGT